MIRTLWTAAAIGLAGAAATPAAAQPISLRDSFPIGSTSQIVCTAQSSNLDRATQDIFDRSYAVTCRDAAAPVGRLYVLRDGRDDPAARLASLRADRVDCPAAAAAPVPVEGLAGVQRIGCRLKTGDVAYSVYLLRRGARLYVAEGLSGYDSALQLGLRTLIANRPVPGDIQVATTGAGDPTAFARAQAGTLDPRRALEEAYRRNNSGAYAESGEFFGTLSGVEEPATRAEALVNQGLQASNLGAYQDTEGLFARAAALGAGDPVLARRLRNYTALHLLNQGETAAALTELDRVIEEDRSPGTNETPIIDRPLADRLSVEATGRTALDAASNTLTRAEKIAILDAQGLALRGTVLRLQGRLDAASPLLRQAFEQLEAVRGGVVVSTIWMRSQIYAEEAAIAETRRQPAEAEPLYRASVALLETDYPGSSALLSARARLASYFARSGQEAQALTLYRDIVAQNAESGTGSAVVRRALEPYFGLLTRAPGAEAAADLFLAAQVMTRPGVAQTQAVLARELSAGSDDAARLFRQSVALTRDVERTRVGIARLEAAERTPQNEAERAALTLRLADYEQAQTSTQSRLAAFPRFRAVAPGGLTLTEMQALLRPGEAYYKLTVLDDSAFAVFATHDNARALRLATNPADIREKVDIIRATIILNEDGALVTYPFDIETAHQLYAILFGPVAAELAGVRHLIFEPDGPMLRLPPNLLVEDDASVARYRQRAAAPGADAYDFTGTAWLGRNREISTAVAPRAFRDVRAAGPSRATRAYLGFGENAPATIANVSASVRGGGDPDADCSWSLGTWDHPIPAMELIAARNAIGRGAGADLVTGAPFTDTGILARGDLDQYRVVHFATHGLVTPPREGCPARPALLTSFGGAGSDGLLSFREVFDLHLDADLIILSACDTASSVAAETAAEAGVEVSGDYSFDGLVRAFVGAGGRMVLASHWQLPQRYDATERLVGGLFAAAPGASTAGALAAAERRLMDAAATSHPYYWAGFAVVGDGETPVVRAEPSRSASSD